MLRLMSLPFPLLKFLFCLHPTLIFFLTLIAHHCLLAHVLLQVSPLLFLVDQGASTPAHSTQQIVANNARASTHSDATPAASIGVVVLANSAS
jgi:hypothetical protein